MIMEAIHYSYINAKTRSMKGELLTLTDYDNLCKAKGWAGLAEVLTLNSYLKDLEEEIDSYDALIGIYYKKLFNAYSKLIHSLSGRKRELVCHLYNKYELENLKTILRSICCQKSKPDVSNLLFPLIKYQNIQLNELISLKDIKEFINALKGTWYHNPLENSLYRYEKEGAIFPLEMALDLAYYKRLWEIVFCLSGKEQKIAREILGIYMDIINIVWIIRFKAGYAFSPEEILNYTLEYGRYISKSMRKKLAYSVNPDDVIMNLEVIPYKEYLKEVSDPEMAYVKLLSYLRGIIKKNWGQFPFQIGTVLDYIFLKEIEVKNLVTITEARRMDISYEDVDQYIVH